MERRPPVASSVVLRGLAALFAAIISVGVVAPGALAAEPGLSEAGRLDLDLPDGTLINSPSAGLIMDPSRRSAYQFIALDDGTTIGRRIDLDELRVAKEIVYTAQDFPAQPAQPHTGGQSAEWIHALDPEEGFLYIPYVGFPGGGINKIDVETMRVVKRFPYQAMWLPEPDSVGCTSASCLPQTPTVAPTIKGMSFVSPLLTGLKPKILLLMQEPAPPATNPNYSTPWVAQWDATTGRQDWIVRVAACSNSALPGSSGLTRYMVPVVQARLGTGIYVACQGPSGIGQVVRLVVDSTNKPQAEQAYPGPLAMIDAFADEAKDRLLLRVSTEDGESWWAFDGPSNSYAGIIGATAQPAQTASGLDPESGRLYIKAPPTGGGRQRLSGGLLISDSRRNPAPQALTFSDFAGDGVGKIHVDVNPTTGIRRILVLDGTGRSYDVLRDNVPISIDPPLRDLDRLTVDVEEKEGETDVNFTGTGHAYGFRVLWPGGIEGALTGGPDASGVRVGKHVPRWLGSPCGPTDRELIVGSVNSAGLSSNLSNASSAVAGGDPGSKLDLAQPTARCYPHPHPRDEDVWGPAESQLGSYPRPFDADQDRDGTTDSDEYAGTEWPFRNTECSGSGKDSTHVKAKPLDRGGEGSVIPQAARDHEVEFQRFTSSVECALEDASVQAGAQVLVHDQASPAVEIPLGELGTLRVAEVSSEVHIYRDPERGLVSRAVSRATGISLGDHFSIDQALAIGEAWAAGRPGTADTVFVRALCGVRIKDEAPDEKVYRPSANVDQGRLTQGDPGGIQIDPEGGGEQPKNVNQQFCGDPDLPVLGQQTALDDEQPVIDAINRVLGARGRASVPNPDGELAQGTPGGYLASVQKDRLDAISSRAVNNDATNTVPALQIITFNDDRSTGRGRQLYQFAGVDASVTYGIFLLNPFEDDFDDLPDVLVDFTGGVPGAQEPFTPPDPVISTPPARGGPITMLFSGIGFLLRSPKDALLAAAVWFILVSPFQLSMRRRALKGIR